MYSGPYAYDASGDTTRITNTIWTTTPTSTSAINTGVQYDAQARLLTVTQLLSGSPLTVTLGYNAAGQRRSYTQAQALVFDVVVYPTTVENVGAMPIDDKAAVSDTPMHRIPLTQPDERVAPRVANSRHVGRVMALQALYEADAVLSADPTATIAQLALDQAAPETATAFARVLVQGVLQHQPQIDARLVQAAPQWPLEGMARVDKSVLRVAVYELGSGQVPTKVAINEAIEIAKEFGGEGSGRFVNGVLGAIYNAGGIQWVADDAPAIAHES